MASADNCFDISDLDTDNDLNERDNYLKYYETFNIDENGNDDEDGSGGGSFPDLPITYPELLQQLSFGLMSPARVIWWPILPHINSTQSLITSFPKMKENSTKRYTWVRQRALSYDGANGDGGDGGGSFLFEGNGKPVPTLYEVYQQRKYEILLLLSEVVDYDHIVMKKLIEIIIQVIPSNDICFHLCCTLLTTKKGYWIGINYNEHQLQLQIFYEIIKTYLINFPPVDSGLRRSSSVSQITFDELISSQILDDVFLNHIFLNFFTTLLPFSHVLRIMDMFLLEGKIVLYRFGMGLLFHYLPLLNNEETNMSLRNGKAFWSEVAKRSQHLKFSELYATSVEIGNRSFFRSLFSFASSSSSSSSLTFHLTTEEITSFEEQARLDLQHPLKRRQSLSGILSDKLPASLRLFNSLLYTSRYFTSSSLSLLFSSFPLSSLQAIDHFTLAFATYHHGYSLHSLYQLTSFYSPTILLLRSLEKKIVIGVFLDDSISPPRPQYRGKGKGGIFRLDGEKLIWYGTATSKLQTEREKENNELQRKRQLSSEEIFLNPNEERRRSSSSTGSASFTSPLDDDQREASSSFSPAASSSTEQQQQQSQSSTVSPHGIDDIYFQYCVSQIDTLIFGGSVEHGTNAIRICSDLRTCSCGPSDTYQNPPLIPEESDPFIIEDVEVFCGHIAIEDFVERHSV